MKNYDMKSGVYKYGDKEFNFNFYTSIPISKKSEFVNTVSYFIVGNNYKSVLKELIFDFYTIVMFTDVDVSYILNSDSFVDDAEEFLNETNIVDIVRKNSVDGIIDELENALNLNIEYLTGIHRNVISESVSSLVNTIEGKINDFSINPEDLIGMMNILSGISGELTMDNLLDAYARSDLYRKNSNNVGQ